VYYDLIASLPQMPRLERAQRLPITRLRLEQRLRRLTPGHAEQLAHAHRLVRWRPDRVFGSTDAALVKAYQSIPERAFEPALRDYVALRMDQRTLVAALRWKQAEQIPERATTWGVPGTARRIRSQWDEPGFRLARVFPWLPAAAQLLAAGDARGLEQLLMDVCWRWLTRCAEQQMFGFQAVFSYVFRWDMLEARLASDADKGRMRFRDLIDKVTHGQLQ
jgi:hypothetical protein